jgi:protein MpaA
MQRNPQIILALACLTVGLGITAARAAELPRSSREIGTVRTRYVLGYSVEHRPIVAWQVAAGRSRRSMLVVGSIAGDEPGGIAITETLASQAAVAGLRLWLIPDVNPDGAARGTRENGDGVDLNRNFPFRWRPLGAPGSRYYSGPRPSSEPESRAVETFIRRTRPQLTIWLHQPYGLIDDSEGPRWAERLLARSLRLPLQPLTDYPGSAIGWNDHIVPKSAFDVELPRGGHLSQATTYFVASAIRSLARRFATARPVH